jgi:hypothetical protein
VHSAKQESPRRTSAAWAVNQPRADACSPRSTCPAALRPRGTKSRSSALSANADCPNTRKSGALPKLTSVTTPRANDRTPRDRAHAGMLADVSQPKQPTTIPSQTRKRPETAYRPPAVRRSSDAHGSAVGSIERTAAGSASAVNADREKQPASMHSRAD